MTASFQICQPTFQLKSLEDIQNYNLQRQPFQFYLYQYIIYINYINLYFVASELDRHSKARYYDPEASLHNFPKNVFDEISKLLQSTIRQSVRNWALNV